MEQRLYDLLTNLVRLGILIATIIMARKSRKPKRARRLPRNGAQTGKIARNEQEA